MVAQACGSCQYYPVIFYLLWNPLKDTKASVTTQITSSWKKYLAKQCITTECYLTFNRDLQRTDTRARQIYQQVSIIIYY